MRIHRIVESDGGGEDTGQAPKAIYDQKSAIPKERFQIGDGMITINRTPKVPAVWSVCRRPHPVAALLDREAG